MKYATKQILIEPLGNNAFAWEERTTKYGRSPTLMIPSLIDGTIDDVRIWSDIVFEEVERWELRSCVGLENHVRIHDLIVSDAPLSFCEFWVSVSEDFHEKFQTVWATASFWNLENQARNRYQNEVDESKTFGTFSHKSTEIWPQEEGQILRTSEW
jgi:hypothetical protein